ncbi:hypothetical protein [Nonomuraea gerenzanensis]|uniref:hypothetical protein n=1 Tax=Nonomuraea gerenzanensis TaxID=93944 RepID=UPI001CD9FA46|nr:hypothetical protein [Nonomuraea gerenzanensis]UBU15078.1 hypothetical protein LCN96_08665 [Nonomuraea gerenzanensis]
MIVASPRPSPSLSSAAMRSRSSPTAAAASAWRVACNSSTRSTSRMSPGTISVISTVVIARSSVVPTSPPRAYAITTALSTTAGATAHNRVTSSDPARKPSTTTDEPAPSVTQYTSPACAASSHHDLDQSV